MTTDISQIDLNSNYHYADYLTWKFKERIELIMEKMNLRMIKVDIKLY